MVGFNEDKILIDFFEPEILLGLQNQYKRYMAIKMAEDGEVDLDFRGFVNMVLILGMNVNLGPMTAKEKRFGL